MLYGLELGLQTRFERHGAYEMFQELKLVFQDHARVERYETSDKFFAYKMEENISSISFLSFICISFSWSSIYCSYRLVGGTTMEASEGNMP